MNLQRDVKGPSQCNYKQLSYADEITRTLIAAVSAVNLPSSSSQTGYKGFGEDSAETHAHTTVGCYWTGAAVDRRWLYIALMES